VNSLTQQEVARCHKRLDEDSATFDRMRAAFTKMSERIAAVEVRVAATNRQLGGPSPSSRIKTDCDGFLSNC
jgi:hypothetical protein